MALSGNAFNIYETLIVLLYAAVLLIILNKKPNGINLNKNFIFRDLIFTSATVLLAIILSGMAVFFGMLKVETGLNFKESIFKLLLLALIMAPAEEIIFRGFVGEWIKKRLGMITSILLTSIIFGIAHLPKGIYFSVMAAIGGVFFSIIYFNTSSIINPIIAHVILGFLYFFFLKGA